MAAPDREKIQGRTRRASKRFHDLNNLLKALALTAFLLAAPATARADGRLAAEQALKILREGATPGDLPILRATDFAYVVNMDVARKLGRFPPINFLQFAETVN